MTRESIAAVVFWTVFADIEMARKNERNLVRRRSVYKKRIEIESLTSEYFKTLETFSKSDGLIIGHHSIKIFML